MPFILAGDKYVKTTVNKACFNITVSIATLRFRCTTAWAHPYDRSYSVAWQPLQKAYQQNELDD